MKQTSYGYQIEFKPDSKLQVPAFSEDSNQNVELVIEKLRAGYATGKTKSLEYREAQLTQLHRGIKDRIPLIVEAMSRDFKSCAEAGEEVYATLQELTETIESFRNWAKPDEASKTLAMAFDTAKTIYEPYGLCLNISPWNFGFNLCISPLVGGIAAGNAFLIKPSEICQNISAVIKQLVHDYLDNECYAVLNGGKDITTKILEHKFDFIFYTGNSTVARIVMQAASKHLTPVGLELGGKSPVVIDDRTCDLRIAARRVAWGRFLNAGQLCVAPDYVIVRPSVKEQFVKFLKEEIIKMYGTDPKNNEHWPRIISEHHTNRISNMLPKLDSPKSHGQIAYGGTFSVEDRYIEPTVLTDLDPVIAPAMQSEIFGPVLPIIEIENLDETISFLQSRDKPLAMYIFSDDNTFIDRLITSVSSGGLSVNDCISQLFLNSLPFGGVGESGMGSYHGKHTFLQFSHKRAYYQANNYRQVEGLMSIRYPNIQLDKVISAMFPTAYYPLPPQSNLYNRWVNHFVSGCYNVGAMISVAIGKK